MRHPIRSPLPFIPTLILLGVLLSGCTSWLSRDSADPETQNYFVYFSNSSIDSTMSCDAVYPLPRDVSDAVDKPFAMLEELFAGPTDTEKAEGYESFFSAQTSDAVRTFTVQNRTAYVNLRDIRTIIPNASSSCGSAMLLSQIKTTLQQFPDIDRVILAIEGDTQTFYDWIQIGCSEENDDCDNEPFRSGMSVL